jgi:hypothetical protein
MSEEALGLGSSRVPRVAHLHLPTVIRCFELTVPCFRFLDATAEGAFCVCKPGVPDAMMQKAIDYACGKGADCTQAMQNGPCYSRQKTLVCNYIVNSYYQKNGPVGGTCDFGGVATVTSTDPSTGNCKFASGTR